MVRRSTPALVAICALLTLLVVVPAVAERTQVRRVEDSLDVFKTIMSIPERDAVQDLMNMTYALAIFPDVRKVGFVIGGQHGKGVLLVRQGAGWSGPLFLTLSGASVGWQVGVQSADVLLFFRTRRSVDEVLRGHYTLGLDASLAAGSLGRAAGASTDTDMKAEIYSYSRTRGIFLGVSLQGMSLDVDLDASSDYYAREIKKPSDVLQSNSLALPPSATALCQALSSREMKE